MPPAPLLQWVNLERNNTFVEDEVTSIERLGPVRFEVRFRRDRAAQFRVRVVAESEPSTYTATEVPRNQNFAVRHTRTQTNRGRVRVNIEEDVFLPAAGGNRYKLEARYRHRTRESRVVETRRKLYYQVIAMLGTPVPALGPTEAYYDGLFLILKNKDAAGSIAFKTTVRIDDWATGRLPLIQAAKAAYTIARYEPWAFASVWVNMIASRQEKEYLPAVSPGVTLGARIWNWGSHEITFTLPNNDYLWYEMDPADDAANGGKGVWLVTNTCKFVEDGTGTVHDIPDANVTIDTTVKRTALGGYNTLKITIPVHVRNFWSQKTGRIWIKLIVVRGFAGGYSEPSINIITVAKRGWWRENDDATRLQTLNHEMGHKFGMVPEGLGAGLDAGAHLYGGSLNPAANQKGHQGPHCENGATYTPANAEPWDGTPACVMFGADACHNAASGTWVRTPSNFCGDCEPQMKKVDLNGRGLAGFSNSITTF